MIEERRPLPESIGGLVDTAVRAYRRRFALYFGVAFAGLILEAIIAYVRPGDEGFFQAGSILVDSFVSALVTLGVVADMRPDERPADAALAGTALGRWGIVAVVTMLVDIVTIFTSSSVFGSPQDTAYGFLVLPIVVAWGSLGFATVIATLDDKTAPQLLIFASIGRSISLALARQNVGRLIALALVAVLPVLVQSVLTDQLHLRKVAAWEFIGSIPIDALLCGPLQAVFTIFYLDFLRRTGAASKS